MEATLGRQFSFIICCFVSGGAELQEGGGLARAWTKRGPKVLSTNAPMKRRGHGTAILLGFAVASYPHENRSKFIEIGSL